MEFTVSHPKGEGTYGKYRVLGIPEPVQPFFLIFLKEREEYLGSVDKPISVNPLIPRVNREEEFWTMEQFRAIRRKLIGLTGINFEWRNYRTFFCEYSANIGVSMESISLYMGHDKETTTREYYRTKIGTRQASSEMNEMFKKPSTHILITV